MYAITSSSNPTSHLMHASHNSHQQTSPLSSVQCMVLKKNPRELCLCHNLLFLTFFPIVMMQYLPELELAHEVRQHVWLWTHFMKLNPNCVWVNQLICPLVMLKNQF